MLRRCRPAAIALGVLHLTTACYSYVPVRTTPHAGSQVALEVTDAGRVALQEKIGPGVVRLEGTVAAVEGSDLLVDASAVRQVRGYITDLGGVRVRLAPEHVTRIDERRFSRTRTFVIAAAVVGTVAAFIISRGFGGKGVPPDKDPGGGPDQ
jgi:hypothetical protein